MPRVVGSPSFPGSNLWPLRYVFLRQQRPRRPSRHHSTQSSSSLQSEPYPKPDHARLIDPTSLRNTLEAVREANRATLIRKVDRHGKYTRLKLSTAQDPAGSSQLSWLKGHLDGPVSPAKNKDARRIILRDPAQKTKRKGPKPELQNGDYPGAEYPVQAEWRISVDTGPRWRHPWMALMKTSDAKPGVNAEQHLGAEISAFAEYFTPKPHETLAAEAAFGDVKAALDAAKTPYSIELVGSRATGLASPLSDLDLNVTSATGPRLDEVQDKAQIIKLLRKLSRHLHNSKNTLRITGFVHHARVPILTGIHKSTSLEFQIQSTSSVYNTTEYAKIFLKEYPTLKGLFLVIKQMLSMRALCIGGHGGLTSYPLLNMIVACLKLKCDHLESNDVAGQLLSFLDMYADIDFYNTGISVLPPEFVSVSPEEFKRLRVASESGEEVPVDRSRPLRKNVSHRMYLIDPADPSNDLGSSAYMIKHVQATIIQRRAVLQAKMRAWHTTAEGSPSESLLGCLVEGDYKTCELDRASLERTLGWDLAADEEEFAGSMNDWRI